VKPLVCGGSNTWGKQLAGQVKHPSNAGGRQTGRRLVLQEIADDNLDAGARPQAACRLLSDEDPYRDALCDQRGDQMTADETRGPGDENGPLH
jgi:hypothetical protein